MRAAHDHSPRHFQITEQRSEIVSLVIPRSRRRRFSIAPAIVSNRVKFATEGRPYLIPNRRMGDAIMNQHDGGSAAAALFVVNLSIFNRDERTRLPCRLVR